MKIVFLGLACLLGFAVGCEQTYRDYMFCLKDKISADYLAFEDEFRNDYIRLAESCFSADGQCAWEFDRNYTAAYVLGSSGPLAGCRLCSTLSRAVRQLMEKADEETMTCVRGVLREGVAHSLEPCIKRTINTYTTPDKNDIPDFDEASFEHRNSILDTTAAFFMVDSNIGVCRRRQGAARGKRQTGPVRTSRQCLDARSVNGAPIWPLHCQTIRQCRASQVTPECQANFGAIEGATCGCVQSGTAEIIAEVNKIGRQLKQILDANVDVRGECEATINGALNKLRTSIDLDAYLKRLVGCANNISPEIKNSLSAPQLVRLGCRALVAAQGTSAQKAVSLQKVMQLGTQILNALISRVTRFCPGSHCN